MFLTCFIYLIIFRFLPVCFVVLLHFFASVKLFVSVERETCPCVCQDLVCLFDVYLTPLQTETFLSKDEVNSETP